LDIIIFSVLGEYVPTQLARNIEKCYNKLKLCNNDASFSLKSDERILNFIICTLININTTNYLKQTTNLFILKL